MTTHSLRPFAFWILCLFLFFQIISAGYGGFLLVIDPTGGALHMPLSNLVGTPFQNYLIPALILFLVLGLFPVFILYGLIFQPVWKGAEFLNIYPDKHWSWTYSLYLGIMLIFWITIQIWMVGGGFFIQTLYALVGLSIVVLTLVPGVMRYYTRKM